MGTVVPGTVKEPASEPSLFSTFIVNFFKTSHSVSRSFTPQIIPGTAKHGNSGTWDSEGTCE